MNGLAALPILSKKKPALLHSVCRVVVGQTNDVAGDMLAKHMQLIV